MSLIVLCKRMKWTWTELMEQPQWFLQHLIALINEETKAQQKASKK